MVHVFYPGKEQAALDAKSSTRRWDDAERNKGSRSDTLDLIPRTVNEEALLLTSLEQMMRGNLKGRRSFNFYSGSVSGSPTNWDRVEIEPILPPTHVIPLKTGLPRSHTKFGPCFTGNTLLRCFWRGGVGVFSRCLICVILHLNVPQGELEILTQR